MRIDSDEFQSKMFFLAVGLLIFSVIMISILES